MASVESIELTERFTSAHAASAERSDSPRNEQSLAPVDRGFGAWSFVSFYSVIRPLFTNNT
jgi:hypothetical protein